jgi:hypothetical protein
MIDNLGTEWQPCVKLPITVHVREQLPGETHISTREGITPVRPDDLIMRGVQGEEYPIGRELFEQTYTLGEAERPTLTDEEIGALWDKEGAYYALYDEARDLARALINLLK